MKNKVLVSLLDLKHDEIYLELSTEDALDELVLKGLHQGGRYIAMDLEECDQIRILMWIDRTSHCLVFRGSEEAMLPLLWATNIFLASCGIKPDSSQTYISVFCSYRHAILATLCGMGVDFDSAYELSLRLTVRDLEDCLKFYREFPGMSFGEFVATVGVRPVQRVA